MTENAIVELLREVGALLSGHFKLSSGLHSPQYLQCAVALQHPPLAEKLGRAIGERWRAAARRQISAVVSPALGGVIIGHEVGRALGTRACFTERVDGKMTLRRGFVLAPGQSVLVVEDVVTTGKSTLETVRAIEFAGGEPAGVACIANRSGKDQVGNLPLTALIDLDIPTYDPDQCPQCQAGEPIQKPGSRPGA
ncbi:MAG TPA: orotate phosphoribosyltransferase [Acidobacteriota bacterium]|jgi:orotate phosphoribosyltransferase